MRIIVLVAALAAATAWTGGTREQPAAPARAGIDRLAWLAGTWIGTSGPITFEERWTPAAGGAMLAVARTVRNGRMVAFEFLRIVERGDGLVYIAQPNGRPPTEFTLTALDYRRATFENPAHDFPKMVQYTLTPEGALEARISGDGPGKPQTFVFKRQD